MAKLSSLKVGDRVKFKRERCINVWQDKARGTIAHVQTWSDGFQLFTIDWTANKAREACTLKAIRSNLVRI